MWYALLIPAAALGLWLLLRRDVPEATTIDGRHVVEDEPADIDAAVARLVEFHEGDRQ